MASTATPTAAPPLGDIDLAAPASATTVLVGRSESEKSTVAALDGRPARTWRVALSDSTAPTRPASLRSAAASAALRYAAERPEEIAERITRQHEAVDASRRAATARRQLLGWGLIIDEVFPPATAELLRERGVDAVHVGEIELAGRDDRVIASRPVTGAMRS